MCCFCIAMTDLNGVELWQTDGTDGGTVMSADIVSGSIGSFPNGLTMYNSKVRVTANVCNICTHCIE